MRLSVRLGAGAVILAVGLGGRVDGAATATPSQDAERDEKPVESYESILRRIARSIEGLKGEHPQLSEFSAAAHCDGERLAITYGYRTVDAQKTGGWTSGVPSPTDHGVWFYIDFHDPDSKLQLHMQPVVPRYRLRDKEVMLLLREGARTKTLEGKLARILLDHGARAVGPPGMRDP